jgi:hypothetical protein
MSWRKTAGPRACSAGIGGSGGEIQVRGVPQGAGFTHFRRAAETPFNLILEARR